jgi:hypothetical protein
MTLEPSHARCIPQEDYSRLMEMMNRLRASNYALARDLQLVKAENAIMRAALEGNDT